MGIIFFYISVWPTVHIIRRSVTQTQVHARCPILLIFFYVHLRNIFLRNGTALVRHTSCREETVFLVRMCFSKNPSFAFIILSRWVGKYGALPDFCISFLLTAPNIVRRLDILSITNSAELQIIPCQYLFLQLIFNYQIYSLGPNT